jgi:hypothetical protein
MARFIIQWVSLRLKTRLSKDMIPLIVVYNLHANSPVRVSPHPDERKGLPGRTAKSIRPILPKRETPQHSFKQPLQP